MAADGAGNPFRDGRANLRDTAKWMVSGTLGAATLIVGSSTISQLGTLDTATARFWIAVTSLILAAGLCWIPFIRAIDVLRSELLSLKQFVDAERGEFKEATDHVSRILGTLPEGISLRQFSADYPEMRARASNPALDKSLAEQIVADIDSRFQTYREACISQLVALRFDRLVRAVKCPGSVILLAFLLFTWAANPPKDSVKLFDKPYPVALRPEWIAGLKAANILPACYAPGAQLVAVAGPEAGPQTAILVPPKAGIPGCEFRKVTLSGGVIVGVD